MPNCHMTYFRKAVLIYVVINLFIHTESFKDQATCGSADVKDF